MEDQQPKRPPMRSLAYRKHMLMNFEDDALTGIFTITQYDPALTGFMTIDQRTPSKVYNSFSFYTINMLTALEDAYKKLGDDGSSVSITATRKQSDMKKRSTKATLTFGFDDNVGYVELSTDIHETPLRFHVTNFSNVSVNGNAVDNRSLFMSWLRTLISDVKQGSLSLSETSEMVFDKPTGS